MLALQAIVSMTPLGRRLLGTTPLGMADLAAIGAGVLGPLLINEFTKPTAPRRTDQTESESREIALVNDKSDTAANSDDEENDEREQEELA
jgi:hypothetical protein